MAHSARTRTAVLKALETGEPKTLIAKRYKISPATVTAWTRKSAPKPSKTRTTRSKATFGDELNTIIYTLGRARLVELLSRT